MICGRPPASRIERADGMPLTGLSDDQLFVDFRDPGFHIDIGNNEIGRIEWKRLGPEELAIRAIQSPDTAALSDIDGNIFHLAALDIRINPFHKLRIRVYSC